MKWRRYQAIFKVPQEVAYGKENQTKQTNKQTNKKQNKTTKRYHRRVVRESPPE